jgi:hypothetical protein
VRDSKPSPDANGLSVNQQIETPRIIGKIRHVFKESREINHVRRPCSTNKFTYRETEHKEKSLWVKLWCMGICPCQVNGGLSASFYEGLGDFDNLPALAGLGLIPDRPDGLGIGWVAHQQACHIGLQGRSHRLKGFLRVTALPAL